LYTVVVFFHTAYSSHQITNKKMILNNLFQCFVIS